MEFFNVRKGWLLPALLFAEWARASNSVVNLSHYDHLQPDFEQMRREEVVGVIHEATYPPGTVDEAYTSRQNDAIRAGLLWGAYHYANASDPIRQADFFADTVASRWRSSATTAAVPEFYSCSISNRMATTPGGTMRVDQAVSFIRRIRERTGKSPGLYASENRIRKLLAAPTVTDTQRATLQSCWLWIANYHYEPQAVAPWSAWTMWQYTGDGICDLPRATHPIHIANVRPAERNIFRGSPSAARAFWELNAWRPAR